jgi:hypothetical protein
MQILVVQGLLWAFRVPARSSIKDVSAPLVATGAILHVIAVGPLMYQAQTIW